MNGWNRNKHKSGFLISWSRKNGKRKQRFLRNEGRKHNAGSNQTKLNISTQLFDRGLLNRNGVMDVWNMAHVEGGEKYYIRKEYAEVSELGKEVTPNAKKDGSGVPNNDPAAIDPDGGGEAN